MAGGLVAGLERALAPVRRRRRGPRTPSASSSGRTCCLILGFLAYLPHSKHLHIATAAINVFFGRTRPRGRLEPLRFDEEGPEEDMRFGAGTVADLTWKQVIDTFSCTECGRCQDACPAWATGKALSPKLLIMGLRDQLFAEGPAVSAGSGEATPLVPERGDRRRRVGLRDLRRVRRRRARSRSSTSTTSSTCAATW